MAQKLFYNTVSELLKDTSSDLMKAEIFDDFRLVGGTSLSLQRGHRMSVDIDLFTDAEYDFIDYNEIDSWLRDHYDYVDTSNINIVGTGRSYFVGKSNDENIKLDIYYTEAFIQDFEFIDGIRLASVEEIIAMKIDLIERGGRMKDFWDIHDLIEEYSFSQMLTLHKQRYPYTHDSDLIRNMMSDFDNADDDFEPICLKNKRWELIKLDLMEFVNQ